MNATRPLALASLAALLVAHLPAGTRTSAAYAIATDTTDTAGTRSTSAAYTHDGSLGGIAGLSTSAAPAQTARIGYIAQLHEVSGLQLAAAPGTVNEGATRQLTGAQLLDDATTLAVPATAITWSVQSGPLAGIDTNGLATAGLVYQDSAATAQGIHAGITGTVGLTVLDSIADNFGAYAGDGIGDDWQVLYFGQDNPAAAPLMDPDADGQNNLFEFTAGLVPTDRTSYFVVNLLIPPSQPAQRSIIFSPRLPGRTYTVKTSATLLSWTDLSAPAVSDNGTERTVTDLLATGTRQFYRVEITRP